MFLTTRIDGSLQLEPGVVGSLSNESPGTGSTLQAARIVSPANRTRTATAGTGTRRRRSPRRGHCLDVQFIAKQQQQLHARLLRGGRSKRSQQCGWISRWDRSWRQIAGPRSASTNASCRCPKPIVAQVAGYCLGGGHFLHMLCDLTLAANRQCRFWTNGTTHGIV